MKNFGWILLLSMAPGLGQAAEWRQCTNGDRFQVFEDCKLYEGGRDSKDRLIPPRMVCTDHTGSKSYKCCDSKGRIFSTDDYAEMVKKCVSYGTAVEDLFSETTK